MGLSVVRLGDLCSGHDGYPSRPTITGSSDVLTNGLPTNRMGDLWEAHGCIFDDGVSAKGSHTVMVNGFPMCRVTDDIDCGSVMMEGSNDVFAG